MTGQSLSRLVTLSWLGAILLAVAGCAQPPPPGTAASAMATAAIPPQQARIWFYRDLDLYSDTSGTPYVRLNGAPVGASQRGAAFYRDVAPGRYRVSVDNYLTDPGGIRDVDLLPGREVYVKVMPLDHWVEGGSQDAGGSYHRDMFYIGLYPAEAARPQIAQSAYNDGTQTAALPLR